MNFIEYEANFLKLLDVLTDGSHIEVNESGMCNLNQSPYTLLEIDSAVVCCIAASYCESFNFAVLAKISRHTFLDPYIFYVSPVVDTIIKNRDYFF